MSTINSQNVIQNVILQPKQEDLKGELSQIIFYDCAFCEKTEGLYPAQRKMCEKLSGNSYYCVNCLRNHFDTKQSRNILPLSFRSVPGYYYYDLYLHATNRKIWISEINDYIEAHIQAGILNPVFSYDPESMLWFVDFNRIGRSRNKIRLSEVMKTILNILICFNMHDHITHVKMSKFFDKYKDAIEKFYTHRYRPADKRLLIPTLASCGVYDTNKKFTIESTRGFVSTKMNIVEKSSI